MDKGPRPVRQKDKAFRHTPGEGAVSIAEAIRPYLNQNEKIRQTVVLRKLSCCFTDQRLILIYRKPFGFKRLFVDVKYQDITGTEQFRSFNFIFFLYGFLLLMAAITGYSSNYLISGAIAAATFGIVFLFPIRGMVIHHKGEIRAEVLGSKNEIAKLINIMKQENLPVQVSKSTS
ncbi:MAG: hypothetical protein JW821_09715 [Deltaproteobacteria bacterium]|nr:hypothetical protein [Deltaproteobacteria bacterium]